MDKTAIQTSIPPAPPPAAGRGEAVTAAAPPASPAVKPEPGPLARAGRLLLKGLRALGSLRIAVVLFALSLGLVFFGTLAQIDEGIWTVVAKYFRSLYVWVPLQIFFPRALKVPGGFPYPGGFAIGGAMLANMLAAYLFRY